MVNLFKVIFILVCAFLGYAFFVADLPSKESATVAALSSDQIKSKAREVAYVSLAREPEKHNGDIVTFRGKVIQAIDDGKSATLRIDVHPTAYGMWDSTVFVDYRRGNSNGPRILEGDIVRFWGEFIGIKSYNAVLGNTIQIPHVVARSVESQSAK